MNKELLRNRYLLIKEIGSGSYATVYQAWDYNLEKMVAIKKIHSHLTLNPTVVEIFKQEALHSAKLQHENILQVNDFFRNIDNNCYIVMEYARGKDLEKIIDKSKERNIIIPLEITIKIIYEISKAINFAHQKKDDLTDKPLNILHLDISPSNILVYNDGKVKITDFGIGNIYIAQKNNSEKSQNIFKGKYPYMSPEQIEGRSVDQKSDLFSIGVVFYELVMGKKPFYGETDQETINAIINSEPDLSKIPISIRSIIKKLLEKNPVRRYESAKKLLEDLESLFSNIDNTKADLTRFINSLFPELKKIEETEKALAAGIISKIRVTEEYEIEKNPLPVTTFDESAARTVLSQMYRVTGKNIKNIFIYLSIFILAFGLFEALIDIPQLITPVGKFIRVNFFPLKVYIDSLPSGADVSLINSKGQDILKKYKSPNKTPLNINNLEADDYLLILTKPGFKTIERKLTLTKKMLSLQKERSLITIPFEVQLKILSVPEGADIYINGIKTGFITPAQTSLEIGEHSIKLSKNKFRSIGSVSIDPSNTAGKCNLDFLNEKFNIDKNLWELKYQLINKEKVYELTGYLEKEITIETVPTQAFVYDNIKNIFLGETPLKVKLRAGKNTLKITKDKYFPLLAEINITDQTAEIDKYFFSLKKPKSKTIRITSQPENILIKIINSKGKDIIKELGIKNTTPVEIDDLENDEYKIILTKDGVKEVTRNIVINEEFYRKAKNNKVEINIPLQIKLKINSFPEGATVIINGKDTGLLTPIETYLEANKYSIKISKPGFLEVGSSNFDKTFTAGKCNLDFLKQIFEIDKNFWKIDYVMQNEEIVYVVNGLLEKEVLFETKPPGAKIYIMQTGQYLPETPVKARLKTGKTRIKITKDKYKPLVTEINIEKDTDDRFFFQLKK